MAFQCLFNITISFYIGKGGGEDLRSTSKGKKIYKVIAIYPILFGITIILLFFMFSSTVIKIFYNDYNESSEEYKRN